MQSRATWIYFMIACSSVCIGYLLYFVGRPGPAIAAIPPSFEQWINVLPIAVEISGQLPSFLHTYAFILLTFLVLGTSSRFNLYLSVSLWALLEVLFEAGQHDLISHSIINYLPGWFEQVPVLDISNTYFLHGTFDPLDLLAIAIASVLALFTVRLAQAKEVHHDKHQ